MAPRLQSAAHQQTVSLLSRKQIKFLLRKYRSLFLKLVGPASCAAAAVQTGKYTINPKDSAGLMIERDAVRQLQRFHTFLLKCKQHF